MYRKRRYFVLNCELYGEIRSMKITCKKIVSTIPMKRRSGFCIYCISMLKVWYILSSPKRGSTILVNIRGKGCTSKFWYE